VGELNDLLYQNIREPLHLSKTASLLENRFIAHFLLVFGWLLPSSTRFATFRELQNEFVQIGT
jgi:hypothetical protein